MSKPKIILSTFLSSLLITTPSYANEEQYIKIGVEPNESHAEVVSVSFLNNSSMNSSNASKTDIILRPGEYPSKPGKRLIVNPNDDYNGLPILYDKANDNYYISEYYFNQRIVKELYKYLKTQGINVEMQDTRDKTQDLNSAGRIAKQKHPTIYLSIHTNSYNQNSSGYFFITNCGDTLSSQLAQRLSYSLKDNKLIPQRENRRNVNNYIGELNEKPGQINILGELGFFSNPNEAKKLSSEEYIEYVAKHMGDELILILQDLNLN